MTAPRGIYLGPRTPEGGYAGRPGYDSEGKAMSIRNAFWGKPTPHMVAFHLSWLSFMVAFWSSFAPAALITSIKNDLKLTKGQIADANVAAVMGGVVARLFIGKFMDSWGPRYAFMLCLWGTAPAVFGISKVTSFAGYTACRFVIAFSLAAVIPCIQWTTNMYNVGVVGTANAIVGGWGNLGGGLTHVAMPALFDALVHTYGHKPAAAWRMAFYLPGALHLLMGLMVFLFGQDMPEGRTAAVRKADARSVSGDVGWPAWRAAILNYRTWILTAVYGATFGVEIAVDNVLSKYFQNHFSLSQSVGGGIASISGLLNIVSRPSGGVVSDLASARFGHRSRVTWLFATAFFGGLFMLLFGVLPTLPVAIVLMVLYSFAYEQACGATYALVPFVSNRSPGLVSGFVSAGGTAGAAIWNGFVFRDQTQKGYLNMGIIMICVSMLALLLEWPAWGGVFRGPRANATEEDYYRNEYTAAEQEAGMHARAMRFAHESSVHGGSQHGSSRFGSRKGSKANLAGMAPAPVGKVDDSARGGRPDTAKV